MQNNKPDILSEYNDTMANELRSLQQKENAIHSRVCANAMLKREKNAEKMAAALRAMMLRG